MLEKESPWCKPRGQKLSHVREGINMVQHRKDPETFFVRNTSRNADEKDLLKQGPTKDKREEVAAYNPYPLHKASTRSI
jgi:hypothetical protein